MSCNNKIDVKIPTVNRCNEIINELQSQFKFKFRYTKKERSLLIKEIQDNPNDIWFVNDFGISHIELK